MSLSADITQALVARLQAVSTSRGFKTDIRKVFYPLNEQDYQVMASDIPEQDMPAVILYQGPVKSKVEHQAVNMFGQYYLEVVQPWVPDSKLWDMVADIGKAIWAGNATDTTNTGYRFHPSVVEPILEEVVPDFGMLQGHRIWVIVLTVHYRVRYTNI